MKKGFTKLTDDSRLPMERAEVILPEQAEGALVELTEYITKKVFKGKWQGGGLLGGEFGYGVEYENDVFMMHPYCWCEQENCGWCNETSPNFMYKPTNCKVWWYKWIGRSQEQEGKLPKNWLEKCKKSI